MRKQILFIHGAGEGAHLEDEKLAESLQQLLGQSYEVRYPEMPNEHDPEYQPWVRHIQEELSSLNDGVILVGHSLGGSILIKFLMETKLDRTIAGIFLIATPFWGGDGWTYEGYEKLALPDEEHSKLSKDVTAFLYHSKDDEIVPFDHLKLYTKALPGATIRALDGRGHQLNNDLSEVANDIKNCNDSLKIDSSVRFVATSPSN